MSDSSQPFNPRLVVGMIVAGIVAFAALLLLLAYGSRLGSGRSGQANALSVAATGFKGLVTLTDELREAHPVEDRAEWAEHLLVVTVDERTGPGDIATLFERRSDRPTLLILPKWFTLRHPIRRGWVRAVGPGIGAGVAPLLGNGIEVSLLSGDAPQAVVGTGVLGGLSVPVPRSPQQIEGPDLYPLLSLPGGGALIAQIGDAPHYIVADPDLLNNHGLRDLRQARAAMAMIDRMNDEGAFVDFDLTMNGQGAGGKESPNMLRLAFEPPFLAMTLALVFAALLAGLHGAFRFGPGRREERAIAFGKAALVENGAGLIRLAGREAGLGGAYADVVRQDAARSTGASPWLKGNEVDAYLDRFGRPGRPGFSELATRLALARDRQSLVAAARALFQWKKEIIR